MNNTYTRQVAAAWVWKWRKLRWKVEAVSTLKMDSLCGRSSDGANQHEVFLL